jgi:hypothetical protein
MTYHQPKGSSIAIVTENSQSRAGKPLADVRFTYMPAYLQIMHIYVS